MDNDPEAVELDALRAQNVELRLRLQEADETLAAIRTGEVDALVVGDDIYTLESVSAASNRLRQDVLAQMDEAVVARDADDHVIYLNPAAERRYAMTASQALGRPWQALCDERWSDPAGRQAALDALDATGHCHTSTLHVTRGGETFPAESSLSRLRDGAGQTIGQLAVIRDVSAQRRARELADAAHIALALRERQFATLVENSPDLIARFDREQRFVYAGPVASRYTGLAPDRFVGRRCAELGLPDELCGPWTEAAARVVATRAPEPALFRLRTPDGELRSFESRLIPEFDARGEVDSVLSIATDVTERLRADAALHESRTHLQFALDAAGIGAWDLDLRTRVARRSLRHDQCFGYREALSEWSPKQFLSHVHPDDRASIGRQFEQAIVSGSDIHFECRVVWPDASEHWIEVHGAVYRADTTATRMLGIIADVTERKLAEQSLRDADRNKDEFLATLAHELRNPLAPIRNALALLRMPAGPRVHEDARNVIERQLKQLVHLVDDLMDIGRITQGKVTLRREPVDVGAAIQQAVETSRPLIEAQRHAMSLDLPAPGELVVQADLTRLIQIVSNLLTNAAKYTPEGGTIAVSARREGEQVAIAVQDNGPGIAPELLPHVFDMFAQVALTLERSQGGLGIGLALVRKFTELHGGTVQAQSDGVGRGARFTLRLPLSDDRAPVPASRSIAPSHAPGAAAWRVLVVDDNIDSAESLAALLDMLGAQTRLAHDGQAALVTASEFRPHAVLLDIGLPLLSGHDVARALREQPGGAALLLIAMSGWGQDDDRRRSHQAGFDHHLVKPLDLDQVHALLEAHRAQVG